MFTGIIETTGVVKEIILSGTNKTYLIESAIADELKVDQSLAHDGVCLTVEKISNKVHQITAVEETLSKTNLNDWKVGHIVNIERCMLMNGRLDGHIVQGHVDTTAKCVTIAEKNGSWDFSFEFDEKFAALIIEKGSITLNGTSLTVFNVSRKNFTVTIIPYTYHHTNIQYVQLNDQVNIEFDIIGKYLQRTLSLTKTK
ncbi:riboflavin synthase [Ferruginibacter lapsinanis]|uniref:riboflavin synthase n=1 Tax=Ferruginibacter lapsinanis TaxID=563172 RepID=UPI001E29A4FD|nr:riboflavin synthase [Ferruginibacter lapsinanis]UEG49015.1 riboflavin synthase [Ferruginibacter lapsinanis]